MTAKVLAPITITPAMITASSVTEPATGETAWNAATSYAIGGEAIRATTHRVYTALASGVDAGLPEATPLRWKDTRPTNKYAAFDYYKSTAITSTSTLTMTVKPGVITDMAFYGLQCDTLRVVCKNANSLATYFDTTYSLSAYLSGELYWEWYFGAAKQQEGLRVMGLPAQEAQVEITLTVSAITGVAAMGIWAIGTFEKLGIPLQGVKVSLVDFSRRSDDGYGAISIKKGLSSKDITGECFIKTSEALAAADVIYRFLSVPCALVVSDDPSLDYLNNFGLLTAEITPTNSHALISVTHRGTV